MIRRILEEPYPRSICRPARPRKLRSARCLLLVRIIGRHPKRGRRATSRTSSFLLSAGYLRSNRRGASNLSPPDGRCEHSRRLQLQRDGKSKIFTRRVKARRPLTPEQSCHSAFRPPRFRQAEAGRYAFAGSQEPDREHRADGKRLFDAEELRRHYRRGNRLHPPRVRRETKMAPAIEQSNDSDGTRDVGRKEAGALEKTSPVSSRGSGAWGARVSSVITG